MNSRRVTMIIAVVVAVAAGLLTVRYLDSVQQKAHVAAVTETRAVIIASRDIRAHEKIGPEMLTRVMKPVDQVEPGSFSDPKQAEGDVSLISIPSGAPITDTKIGVPASIGITGKLRPGMRAISIPVDYIKSVSGLVEPGDRVDVLASSNRGRATRTIIRGAVVLAVNASLEPAPEPSPGTAAPAGNGAGPASVTLSVTPDQADALTFADLNATLRLALRSPAEPMRSFPVHDLDLDVPAPSNGNVPPPAALPPPAEANAVPAVKATPGILVIEGSSIIGGAR